MGNNRGTEIPEYKVKVYHMIRLAHPEFGVYYIPFTQALQAQQTTRLSQGYPTWDVSTISATAEDLDTSSGVEDFRPFSNGETTLLGVRFTRTPSWDKTERTLQ